MILPLEDMAFKKFHGVKFFVQIFTLKKDMGYKHRPGLAYQAVGEDRQTRAEV